MLTKELNENTRFRNFSYFIFKFIHLIISLLREKKTPHYLNARFFFQCGALKRYLE